MTIRPVPVALHQPRRHAVAPANISRSLGAQSIPNNTNTFIDWDTEHTDVDGVWPSVTWGNDFLFGDNQSGLWIVSVAIEWAASAAGTRRVFFENAVGGRQDPADARGPTPSGACSQTLTALIDLEGSGVGTLGLGVRVFQDSGAALNLVGAGTGRARIIAYRISR